MNSTNFLSKLFLLFDLHFTVYLKECQNHSVIDSNIISKPNFHLLFKIVTKSFVVVFEKKQLPFA